MLSFSYRAFLVMDQLRRRANISVVQLQCVSTIEQTCYSRISSRVYEGLSGVLHTELERNVVHTLKVLAAGYVKNVISPTTIKQPSSIEAVLKQLESEIVLDAVPILVDCRLGILLDAANNVLNA